MRSPALSRLSDTPSAPACTRLPTSAIAETAEWTAMPTKTQMTVHTAMTMSLTIWPSNRDGLVA